MMREPLRRHVFTATPCRSVPTHYPSEPPRGHRAVAAPENARTPDPHSRLLHRCPQARSMQLRDIALHLFLRPAGYQGPALVVNVQHQLGGVLLAVTEDLLEHVGHIRHEVHRVVPDDGLPGFVRRVTDSGILGNLALLGLNRLGHTSMMSRSTFRDTR